MAKKDPYDIQRIFEEMALGLIASLRRNFERHKKEEIKEGFRWDRWQLTKLRNLFRFRRDNSKIIRDAFREAEKLSEDVIRQSFVDGEKAVDNEIRKVLGGDRLAGYEVPGEVGLPQDEKPKPKPEPKKPTDPRKPEPKQPKKQIPYHELPRATPENQFFGMNEKKLDALQQSVRDDLRKAEHGVLRKMDDVYRQVIYKAEVNMAAGAKTLDQAVDMATKEFLERGIDTITYSDGRKVNIASWAEMALRTASQRATFLGEGKKRNEWGIYTVVMSAHDNCSPMCLPYQGTVMIDDVYANGTQDVDPKLVLLSEAMRNHAFHPNCRHSLSTFFPGISNLPDPTNDEKATRNYEAEQHQRYIERQIRKYKRLEAGSLDAANVNKYSDKVKEWQQRLRDHLDAHPELRRNYARERMIETFDPPQRNDILSDRKWLKAPFSTDKRLIKHVEEHGHEYGGISKEEYLNMARDLLAAPIDDDVEGFLSEENTLFKYRNSTNDFAIGRPDGRISTIFKPTRGREYWLEQIEEYGRDSDG